MQVTMEIPPSRIASLLCCAFEGGAGYWCRTWDYVEPQNPVPHFDGDDTIYRHIDYPLCEGGAALLWDIQEHRRPDVEADSSKLLRLDLDAIKRGLDLMPKLAPKLWGRFLAEDEDADVGDVFLQCCVLGEHRYG